MGGGWVLEADIEGFFDAVDHTKLHEILRQRVSDGVLLRLVGKWLKAGVMEEGMLSRGAVKDPRAEGVVVSGVELSDDLSMATVYVRLLDPSYKVDLVDAVAKIPDISEVSLIMQRTTVEI